MRKRAALFLVSVGSIIACGGSDDPAAGAQAQGGSSSGGAGSSAAGAAGIGGNAGTAGTTGGSAGAGAGGAPVVKPIPEAPSSSDIKHLVVILQENHTFDNHFGRYCTAPTGSNPTCNDGPACCEAAPTVDAASGKPVGLLDDAQNGVRDPNHTQACELALMNGGKMDLYVTDKTCGHVGNFVTGDATSMKTYWDMATNGAIADHYFQPVVGQSSANDMYFARAKFVFLDNDQTPASLGANCAFSKKPKDYDDPTIADLLVAQKVPWATYIEGYQTTLDAVAMGKCPEKPDECKAPFAFYPCTYDASDIPFMYYPTLKDNPDYFHDYGRFAADVAGGALPAFTMVRSIGYHSEHPGFKTTLSDGQTFVKGVVDAIAASPYAKNTLVLITYDEGGGYFDHVKPPPTSAIDNQPYGTRVPMIAVGAFARKNHVSHVVMEHSSVVKFIEWNWLSGKTGQLGTRDTTVANIGSLIDPAQKVPED